MEFVIKGILFFLVFVQGGFFEPTYRIVAIMLGIILLIKIVQTRGKDFKTVFYRAKQEIYLFLGMVFLFLISIWYHHTPLQNSGRISYLYFSLLFYISLFFVKDFLGIYKFIVIVGVAESIVAVLVYGGIEIPGVLVNARFMGTFQYANATALFMGIVLLVQWGISSQKDILMISRPVMHTTLILTFSAGGIVCYCVVIIILQILDCHRGKDFLPLIKTITEIILGAAFAVGIYVAKFRIENMNLVWLLLICLIAVSIYSRKMFQLVNNKNIKIVSAILVTLFLLESGTGVCLFGNRIQGTGLERLRQMSDGMDVLCKNPLFGLGIHGWERYIENRSNITYHVSLIHNSYLQLGLEAGIFLVILLLCLFGKWFYGALREKGRVASWQKGIMVMAVVHFMADITFFFGGIIVVVMSCIFYKNAVDNKKSNKNRKEFKR